MKGAIVVCVNCLVLSLSACSMLITDIENSAISQQGISSSAFVGAISSDAASSSSVQPSSSSASWCSVAENCGQVVDIRDGQVYDWTKIGDQIWMADNLNYNTMDQRTSWCYYNLVSNCIKYGRLYSWVGAMAIDSEYANKTWIHDIDQQGICLEGWHLPNAAEWNTLRGAIGTMSLKAATGWSSGLSQDYYGFAALPGGEYLAGAFTGDGEYGYWWTASEYTYPWYAWAYRMSYQYPDALPQETGKSIALSVRCVKN